MRQLRKNRQILYYASYDGQKPIYEHDDGPFLTEDGKYLLTESGEHLICSKVMTTNIDGVEVAVVSAIKDVFTPAEQFKANISFNSGETQLGEYGLDTSDYTAIISAEKGKLPFDERTLIWFQSEVEYDDDGDVRPETADYKVIAIKTSLNEERFLLKKRVDD